MIEIDAYTARLSSVKARRLVVTVDDVLVEGGVAAAQPLRRAVVAAVIRNPWAGMGYVDDLWDEMNRVGNLLSEILAGRMLEVFGGQDAIHGFGKGAIVGLDGEIEHASGILHGPAFGPNFRLLVGGTAGISAAERRGSAGTSLAIPTNHKTERAIRNYYQSVDLAIADAPHADEMVIAFAATGGPRVHARVGDLTTDHIRARSTAGDAKVPEGA
ncbi:amino acid synthesis family protein [Microbacterium sp. SSM24]|uniref:amino acid synthesis family protein n=1 Tax=Microbacterium sp. SSM24 TaxID=2991714 RepID=UPI0022267275|nr:amino acid synthesis family protein [Microbacterium sp. SSM24]MCW3493368.1 amino acid synthesis family protein [Microbacterium sp. SSM24]